MTQTPPGPAGYGPPPGYRTPPPTAPNGAALAEFGERLLAYLIDVAILTAVSFVFLLPAISYQLLLLNEWMADFADRYGVPGSPEPDSGQMMREAFSAMAPALWLYLAGIALTLLATYLYRVEMMWRSGQTLGKRAMRLRVVPLDPAAPLTRGVAVKRWLVDSVAVQLVPLLGWLDGLWQLWDKPYRQCLHDRAAGTTVVKVAR